MSWKTLVLLSGSESPVVVVLSGSMEPAFYRGDILFLKMGADPFRTGEVVVYSLQKKDTPIVHRVIQVHDQPPSDSHGHEVDILTKVSGSGISYQAVQAMRELIPS
jgi:signal peptidase